MKINIVKKALGSHQRGGKKISDHVATSVFVELATNSVGVT